MTSHRFDQLRLGKDVPAFEEREEFDKLMTWWQRSQAAKQAVETKRSRYTTWPTRKNDHRREGP